MNKQTIIEFFDRNSADWDKSQEIKQPILNTLLDYADIQAENDILDVACGTGILIPFYQERKVATITGLDISPKMIAIATQKYPQVNFIVADAETYLFTKKYDSIVVFNAFPHFVDGKQLVKNLSTALKPTGRLTICHDTNRKTVDSFHQGSATAVSKNLISGQKLATYFSPYLNVDIIHDDSQMYIVSGTLK